MVRGFGCDSHCKRRLSAQAEDTNSKTVNHKRVDTKKSTLFFCAHILIRVAILLKRLLAEAKLYAYSMQEVLEKFLKFDGKTLILFDTETTGMKPHLSYNQLTQVAAIAFDGTTLAEKGEFSKKVNLGGPMTRVLNDPNSPEAKDVEKQMARHLRKYKKPDMHPSELLKMTGYESGGPEGRVDEKEILIAFEAFINQFDNVILVAHNAGFDMKAMEARRRYYGMAPMKRVPVLDTARISRFFFIPAMIAMEDVPEVKTVLDGLLAKTKYKSYSSSLGNLAKVLGVKMDGWHDAKEDVKMLMAVLQKVVAFMQKNSGADIRKQQGIAAKRFRKMP